MTPELSREELRRRLRERVGDHRAKRTALSGARGPPNPLGLSRDNLMAAKKDPQAFAAMMLDMPMPDVKALAEAGEVAPGEVAPGEAPKLTGGGISDTASDEEAPDESPF